MRNEFPIATAGQRVGLLGGSFDPAHEGHVRLTEEALKRFGLDRVWWLVTPGNPLKAHGPAPLPERIAYARQIMDDPRVTVLSITPDEGHYWQTESGKVVSFVKMSLSALTGSKLSDGGVDGQLNV